MKTINRILVLLITTVAITACNGNVKNSTATESSFASTPNPVSEESVEAPADALQAPQPAVEEREQPIDEHAQAVNELKAKLAKIDGMKTGPNEFYSFSYKYLEEENVIEHKWRQSIVPKEAADQEVIRALKQEGIKKEKTIIKGNSELMNLMLPLKPTIRCIVYYPDDTEMLRVSFPFNELYFDN